MIQQKNFIQNQSFPWMLTKHLSFMDLTSLSKKAKSHDPVWPLTCQLFWGCPNTPAGAWTPPQGHYMHRFLLYPRSFLFPQHLVWHKIWDLSTTSLHPTHLKWTPFGQLHLTQLVTHKVIKISCHWLLLNASPITNGLLSPWPTWPLQEFMH